MGKINQKTGISFDDGSISVEINDDPGRIIKWTPTDINFVDRLFEFLDWVQSDLQKEIEKAGIDKLNPKNFDDYERGSLIRLGEEFNSKLDMMFDEPASVAIFGKKNPMSPIKNGKLLFENFLDSLMPLMKDSIDSYEEKRKKYTKAARDLHPAKKK